MQKLILLAIFVLACAGAAALLGQWLGRRPRRRARPAPLLARLAAGVCYAWNPFVAERLIMGQWAMLLGYAGLPWVLRELLSHRPGAGPAGPGWPAVMVPAAVGGFAAMSVTVIAAVPVALVSSALGLACAGARLAAVLACLAVPACRG